jgi:hypothetical protein
METWTWWVTFLSWAHNLRLQDSITWGHPDLDCKVPLHPQYQASSLGPKSCSFSWFPTEWEEGTSKALLQELNSPTYFPGRPFAWVSILEVACGICLTLDTSRELLTWFLEKPPLPIGNSWGFVVTYYWTANVVLCSGLDQCGTDQK